MKFFIATLLLAPLALALDGPLPEKEVTENSVPVGLANSDVLQADSLSAAAACPVRSPYLCPYGFCCPYSPCCRRECCAPDADFCYDGRCYKYV
ncbi:hypothetical protein N657DRAFT_684241 [Parathielavia appendiculata]|uniref:Uncharacterized protein n=1 Tax=Parathielavia appendiculata TaxID=2587402 RepID=A0AAN6TS36_9PEZI|nr:hypothetical protein N657DRAFT_684241 [Parathielavia appendiculata]